MAMDCSRAEHTGLVLRPLGETIADTAAWLALRDNSGAWKHVLSGDDEARLLAP